MPTQSAGKQSCETLNGTDKALEQEKDMARVVHFEINAADPEKVAKFYGDIFGWKITKWSDPMDYWMVETGDANEMGINGGITKMPGAQKTVNTLGVSSVDEYMAKVRAGGGKVMTEKMAVMGMGYIAYCEDTEGNTFGIWETDENAK